MPMHINAPSRKLTLTASAKRQPARANAMPPGGNAPRFFNMKKNAATSRATPMNSWIVRRGSRLTSPAPSQAPAAALPTMQASSTGSTATAVTNSTVSRKAEELCPTLSVPGISSSAGAPRNLNSAVVGANEPMPSVSRKSVTTPIAMSASRALAQPVAPGGPDPADDERDVDQHQHGQQPDFCRVHAGLRDPRTGARA